MEQEQPQSPEPKKPVRKRATPKDMPNRYEPLDELGFFKKGKEHDRLLDAATCHCDGCMMNGMQKMYEAGVTTVPKLIETWGKYEELSAKVHRDKMDNPRIEEITIISNEDLQKLREGYRK